MAALTARFTSGDRLLEAARRVREHGYSEWDTYTPYPMEELEALVPARDRVPLWALLGGLVGGSLGYFMQWYANVVDYPIRIADRPLHSWPAFIPVTFELTVLGASLAAVVGMLVENRLPALYHPAFDIPGFENASQTAFFLAIEAHDPLFDPEETRALLLALGSEEVSWIGRGSA